MRTQDPYRPDAFRGGDRFPDRSPLDYPVDRDEDLPMAARPLTGLMAWVLLGSLISLAGLTAWIARTLGGG